MSDQDENINAPPPSAENGAYLPPPPEAVIEPDTSAEDVKEALAESLRKGTLDEPLPSEPALSAPTPPEPVKAEGATPPAKPTEPAKAPEKPAEVEDPIAAYDDPEDLRPDEVDPKFTKIRERIQKQQSKLREARRDVDKANRRIAPALEAGFDEDAVDDWLLLGARANLGDPGALHELASRLQAAGYKLAPAAPVAPPQPAPQPAAIKPTEAQVQAVYDRHFKPLVASYRMDEEAALEAAAGLAATLHAPAPAPSQPHTQVPTPAAHAPEAPVRAPQQDPIQARVLKSMDQMDAQYATAIPEWDKVKAIADKMVKDELKAGKRLDPLMWPADWQQKVRLAQVQVLREKQQGTRPAVSVQDTSIRPGRQASTGVATNPREAVAEAMRAGNLDALPV